MSFVIMFVESNYPALNYLSPNNINYELISTCVVLIQPDIAFVILSVVGRSKQSLVTHRAEHSLRIINWHLICDSVKTNQLILTVNGKDFHHV